MATTMVKPEKLERIRSRVRSLSNLELVKRVYLEQERHGHEAWDLGKRELRARRLSEEHIRFYLTEFFDPSLQERDYHNDWRLKLGAGSGFVDGLATLGALLAGLSQSAPAWVCLVRAAAAWILAVGVARRSWACALGLPVLFVADQVWGLSGARFPAWLCLVILFGYWQGLRGGYAQYRLRQVA